MQHLYISFILLLVYYVPVIAQDTDTTEKKPKYGFYASYGYNYHSSSFGKLPGFPSCCGNYDYGEGKGISAGAIFEFPIIDSFYGSLRLAYSSLGALLRSYETTNVLVNGLSQEGKFEHYLNTKISELGIDFMPVYMPVNSLNVYLGLRIAYYIDGSFSQYERIVEPEYIGTFPDGTRIRNQYSDDIPGLTSLHFGLKTGIGYEFPLNNDNSFIISPEVFYIYYPIRVADNLQWYIQTFQAGLALKYIEPPPPPLPPPAPPSPPVPELEMPRKPPVLSASLRAVLVEKDGNIERADFSLKIEDFISLNMRPLLMYVFFDENSSKIPERYIKLNKNQTNDFILENLKDPDALKTYYNVLNIIGRRMRDNPSAQITLTGTNSNIGNEKANLELSLSRALALKDYLVNVWEISEKRIKTSARNLPSKPSRTSEVGADDENRRVEISSDNFAIDEPVITNDTLRIIADSKIVFQPKVMSVIGTAEWTLKAEQGNRILFIQNGNDEPPQKIDWQIGDNLSDIRFQPGRIHYNLTTRDKVGQTYTTPKEIIPVEQLSIDRKRLERIEDKEFEQYSLILFDYGKSKLEEAHKKLLNFVRNRLTKEAKVVIYGFTDSIGEEEVNKRLSEARAREVAKALKFSGAEVAGIGESRLLYDNNYPEGRFYCRTVTIEIITPILDNSY